MEKDLNIENKIVKGFFYENKRERILFELSNGENNRIIQRLSDNPDNYLNRSCIIKKSTKGRTNEEIIDNMRLNGVNQACYVFCEYESLNRKECDLQKALETLNMDNFAFLIVGLPSGYAFFQGEAHASFKPNCFLKPEKRFDNKIGRCE